MALGLLLLGWVALNEFSLSALDEPGEIETLIATAGKHFLVGRSASKDVTPASGTRPANPAFGRGLYLAECSSCHGVDGCTPTEMGLRMYPRAADLGSAQDLGPTVNHDLELALRRYGIDRSIRLQTQPTGPSSWQQPVNRRRVVLPIYETPARVFAT